MPAPRWRPTASISSMKMMHGQFCLACSNRSRTRLAPTPTNMSTKSEPEIEKNGTPASPATARASSVLPVPGGPNSRTPLGMRAPSAWNFLGFSRNSLISCNSSTASSTPATSLNVILGESTDIRLARLLPKLMTLLPPPCIWFIRKIQKAKNSTKGRIVTRMLHHGEPEVTEPSTTTFWLVASAAEIAWSISEVLGMPIVTVWLPSALVTLYLRLLSPRLVFRYLTPSWLLAACVNSFQVFACLLLELSMIIFWAKNASTTTTTIGKAALLKNLLTGCFAYLPGELT